MVRTGMLSEPTCAGNDTTNTSLVATSDVPSATMPPKKNERAATNEPPCVNTRPTHEIDPPMRTMALSVIVNDVPDTADMPLVTPMNMDLSTILTREPVVMNEVV